MSSLSVISFSDSPSSRSERRLADIPGCVIEGDPHQVIELYFQSPDESLSVGRWTSTPGKWHAFAGKDEYCYITEGHCELIDESGKARSYRSGDSFLIPNGFKGFWNVIETTTKQFVIRQY